MQGLSDAEEFVIHKTLKALTALTELGLLQKPILHELLADIVPFFCHPVSLVIIIWKLILTYTLISTNIIQYSWISS